MFTFKFKFKVRHDQTHTPYLYRFKLEASTFVRSCLSFPQEPSDHPVASPFAAWRFFLLENRLRSVSSQEIGSVLVREGVRSQRSVMPVTGK